ncbi:MAG: hypothetical protein HY791_26930 [Deltaproteobacteria bacterium]|nr:hypothetical protein [Deltaproteobacteria bacterium]
MASKPRPAPKRPRKKKTAPVDEPSSAEPTSPEPTSPAIDASDIELDRATAEAAAEAKFDHVEKALEEAAFEALAEAHARSEAAWKQTRQDELRRENERAPAAVPRSARGNPADELLARLVILDSVPESFARDLAGASLDEVLGACKDRGFSEGALARILASLSIPLPGARLRQSGSYLDLLGLGLGFDPTELAKAHARARTAAAKIPDPRRRREHLQLLDEALTVLSRPDLLDRLRQALADPHPRNLHF